MSLLRRGAALATLSGAVLLYEVLLTRVFSVTMGYHFAFAAISVALLGGTIGAGMVHALPCAFPAARSAAAVRGGALCFALTSLLAVALHARLPFSTERSPLPAALTLAGFVIPFACAGVAVCLVLTRHAAQAARLYAADLAGAAAGCAAFVLLLPLLGGPGTVVAVAAGGALAALLYPVDPGGAPAAASGAVAAPRLSPAAATALLAACALLGSLEARSGGTGALLRLRHAHGRATTAPLFESWNTHSRITVHGDPAAWSPPFGWGLSARAPHPPVRQLLVTIDSGAATVLPGFDGDLAAHEYLKWDVTNLAHHLRGGGEVLVIGSGGGRDLLAALVFGQRSVTGVELNRAILDAAYRRYGAFTGHLDQRENVEVHCAEARGFLARSARRWDVIQISLIDTFAASGAGAYALAENPLYTVEAWRLFLDRLAPGGLLSVSRWHYAERPGEMLRATALAVAALRARGVEDPSRHLLVARTELPRGSGAPGPVAPEPVGTLLVSPDPLDAADLERFDAAVERLGFTVVLSPRARPDALFATLVGPPGPARELQENYLLDLRPPTDDRPFFFNMLRFERLFGGQLGAAGAEPLGGRSSNLQAVVLLARLLAVLAAAALLVVVLPWLSRPRPKLGLGAASAAYFAGIGLGFLLVEVALLQRLSLHLGSPSLALSVVLGGLLLFSGLGSMLTPRWSARRAPAVAGASALVLGLLANPVFQAAGAWPLAVRTVLALLVTAPLGLALGAAFPAGLRALAAAAPRLAPWAWAVNGAFSILGAALAVALSMASGITSALAAGGAAYALALAGGLRLARLHA